MAIASGAESQALGLHSSAFGSHSTASETDSLALGYGAKAQAKNAVALGTRSVADRENTVSVGNENTLRQITHVAAGTKANDAVNFTQLKNVEEKINNIQFNTQKFNKELRAGIAGTTALAFLQNSNGVGKSAISAAVGTYKGETAVAVGFSHGFNNNIQLKLGASVNGRSDMNAGGSIGYHW